MIFEQNCQQWLSFGDNTKRLSSDIGTIHLVPHVHVIIWMQVQTTTNQA